MLERVLQKETLGLEQGTDLVQRDGPRVQNERPDLFVPLACLGEPKHCVRAHLAGFAGLRIWSEALRGAV